MVATAMIVMSTHDLIRAHLNEFPPSLARLSEERAVVAYTRPPARPPARRGSRLWIRPCTLSPFRERTS